MSQLSATGLNGDDRSPSFCSLISHSAHVVGKDGLCEPDKRGNEDYKIIKEEKAETGRVCLPF